MFFIDPSGLAEVRARAYAEAMGATVTWLGNVGNTAVANITYAGRTVTFTGQLVNGNMMIDPARLHSVFGWGTPAPAPSASSSVTQNGGSSSTGDFSTPQNFTVSGGGLTVTRDGYCISISARFFFPRPGLLRNRNRIPFEIFPGSDRTHASAFMEGVRYHWSGTFGEFTVTVQTSIARTRHNAIPVYILYGYGISNRSGYWSIGNRGTITMFQGDVCRVDLQTPTIRYDSSQFMWVSGHEFGHALGLFDVVGVNSIMYGFGMAVTANDIQMILYAAYTGRRPRW